MALKQSYFGFLLISGYLINIFPQAARLLAAFREFKRRESVGLVSFFANKLAALEEALLGSR